jgi:hypothetical protein
MISRLLLCALISHYATPLILAVEPFPAKPLPSNTTAAPKLLAPPLAPVVPRKPWEPSAWSFSLGTAFRTLSADFASHGPGILPIDVPGSFSHGRGNVGTYNGANGTTEYDDGSVGPAVAITGPGGATSSGFARSNSRPGSSSSGTGRPNGLGGEITEYNFHSHSNTFAYDIAYFDQTATVANEAVGQGAYVQMRYEVATLDHSSLALTFGYTWLQSALSSGDVTVASESLMRIITHNQYTANYDAEGGLLLYDLATATAVVGAPPAGSDYHDPRYSRNRFITQKPITTYFARAQSDLDVNLHEFVWTVESSISPTPQLHLGLAIGPSLNIVDTNLETNGAWYREGLKQRLAPFHDEQSRNFARLGVACQASAQFALGKRVSLQAAAGYHYVPTVHITNAFTDSWVDASGWQLSLGVSIQF